jgi:hypothetical protein
MHPVRDEIRNTVFQLLFEYSGKRSITEDSMISADLHIRGGDAVQALDELEDRFNVDLRPLIERDPMERTGLLHRLFGVPPRRSGVDVSVRELIDYLVDAQTREQT